MVTKWKQEESSLTDADVVSIDTGSRIKELLTIPPREDMAALFARTVFENKRQRICAVRLHKRHVKYKIAENEEALRAWCASSIGEKGRGRFEADMASVGLWDPQGYSIVTGNGKPSKKEQIIKGSDFRDEQEEKPDNMRR